MHNDQIIFLVNAYYEKAYLNLNFYPYPLHLILDYKNIPLKNKLIKAGHNQKIFMRPAWKLISDLGPYKKKQKMNLRGAREIYKRVINLPSSQSLMGEIKYSNEYLRSKDINEGDKVCFQPDSEYEFEMRL